MSVKISDLLILRHIYCAVSKVESILYKSVQSEITESITVLVASERCNAPQNTRHQISSMRIISGNTVPKVMG